MIFTRSHRTCNAIQCQRHRDPLAYLLPEDFLTPVPLSGVEPQLRNSLIQGRKIGITPEQVDRAFKRQIVLLFSDDSSKVEIVAYTAVPGTGDGRHRNHKRDGEEKQSRCHKEGR